MARGKARTASLLLVVFSLAAAPPAAASFVLSATAAVRAFDGAVSPAVCRRLDAAAAAMGGGHVLYDREQPPSSPIEQMIDRSLRRVDDTSRFFSFLCAPRGLEAAHARARKLARRLLTALDLCTPPASLPLCLNFAGMQSIGGETSGCPWTLTVTPMKVKASKC
jgi:hypothetical protein